MGDQTKIIEISVIGGKALVTFADGKLALLEGAQIRSLAVRVNALIPLPKDLMRG